MKISNIEYICTWNQNWNAFREKFPRGIPIMDGSSKLGAEVFVDEAHAIFINEAKTVLKLMIDDW